jgi:hypothetical protein
VDGELAATRTNVRPLARSILRDYDLLLAETPAQMKEVLRALIREIRVTPGKAHEIDGDKVVVTPRWT